MLPGQLIKSRSYPLIDVVVMGKQFSFFFKYLSQLFQIFKPRSRFLVFVFNLSFLQLFQFSCLFLSVLVLLTTFSNSNLIHNWWQQLYYLTNVFIHHPSRVVSQMSIVLKPARVRSDSFQKRIYLTIPMSVKHKTSAQKLATFCFRTARLIPYETGLVNPLSQQQL